eukprot:comp19665_c0_seq1/m.37712 comp19665_c0_seq1/g.37712  ORF comp19665_c0_seq1/g.37712 comp19665_c0_seq1/m.37712 type:complete len:422 (-) comp19665_c0_seq1:33-1298(-)
MTGVPSRVVPATIKQIMSQPIHAVPGFSISGVEAGIKKRGGLDVCVLRSQVPSSVACLFTKNVVQAAPIAVSRAALTAAKGKLSSCVINAGCANACTGTQGEKDAAEMGRLAAPGPEGSIVMSTGVIGAPLPMDKVRKGIAAAVAKLTPSAQGWHDASRAIMTTDTFPKIASRKIELSSGVTTVTGITKGSGMIHPNMATMLSVIATDATVPPDVLQMALLDSVDRSFHSITVDGDTSTNDTVAAFANGGSAAAAISSRTHRDYAKFTAALSEVAIDLAKLTAFDGEGASKFITVNINDAVSDAEARKVGRTIGTSPLVKTAMFASDANWGRILAAAGYSGAVFEANRVSCIIASPSSPHRLQLLKNGEPFELDEEKATHIFKQPEIHVTLDLGTGKKGNATVWTCDLGHAYVDINASYRS